MTSCSRNENGPKECFRQETAEQIIGHCEKNNSCTILVTANNYGDPCIGSPSKQMMIQFQCLDTLAYNKVGKCSKNRSLKSICPILVNSFSKKYFERKSCEPASMSISCSPGKVISILCSFYGIDPNLRCSKGFYTGINKILLW